MRAEQAVGADPLELACFQCGILRGQLNATALGSMKPYPYTAKRYTYSYTI
jgi:hypothetical protein